MMAASCARVEHGRRCHQREGATGRAGGRAAP